MDKIILILLRIWQTFRGWTLKIASCETMNTALKSTYVQNGQWASALQV